MKHCFQILTVIVLVALTGCATSRTTAAGNSEAQVRQQLAEVSVLRDANAKVRDVRFSSDRERILVLLDLPAGSTALSEIVLKHDGFHRYRGDFFSADHQNARKPITIDLGQK
jgi:hypothetical protein